VTTFLKGVKKDFLTTRARAENTQRALSPLPWDESSSGGDDNDGEEELSEDSSRSRTIREEIGDAKIDLKSDKEIIHYLRELLVKTM